MSKITISQVKEALPKIEAGLQKYLCLRDQIHDVNVSKEVKKFQKPYKGFFRMRRNEDFCKVYFGFMEKHKNDKRLTFEAVLKHLHRNTERVEASFASKLLSMINPDMPVLDRHVLKVLGIPAVGTFGDAQKRIGRGIAAYKAICELYNHHFKSGEAKKWIELFDKHYPDAKSKITGVKKIDLILWKMGN